VVGGDDLGFWVLVEGRALRGSLEGAGDGGRFVHSKAAKDRSSPRACGFMGRAVRRSAGRWRCFMPHAAGTTKSLRCEAMVPRVGGDAEVILASRVLTNAPTVAGAVRVMTLRG